MTTTEPKCPKCGSIKIGLAYGLAGGGIGAYNYCEDCGEITDKWQDPEYDDKPGTDAETGEGSAPDSVRHRNDGTGNKG